MRRLTPFVVLVVATGLIACVGDTPIQGVSDSGVQDAAGDTFVPGSDGSTDAASDGSEAGRPVPIAKGNFNWESVVGGDTPRGIGYDGQGNTFFTYDFYNTTTVNAKGYTSAGAQDIMVVKYDPKGKVIWARQYGAAGDDEPQALAVDASGDVYLTIVSESSGFSFAGGISYAKQGSNFDGFVVKLSGKNGDGVWLTNVSKSGENFMSCGPLAYGGGKLGVACSSVKGLALVKASDSTPLNLTCLECGGSTPQNNNMYIASLDPSSGKAFWGTVIAADKPTSAYAMVLDSKGAMALDFTSSGTLVHDATNSVNWTYQGVAGALALVVKLAAANGAGVWLKEFTDGTNNGNNQTSPGGLAVDSSDNVIFGGDIHGTVPFGTFTLKSGGGADVFVAQLKSAFGDVLWARTFGGALDDRAPSVGVDPWDEIYLSGSYLSTDAKIDAFPFPAATSPHAGNYLTKLDPTGKGLWATGIVSPSTSVNVIPFGNGLAVDPNLGGVAITGWFQGTVDLGDGTPVASPNGVDDLFVVARSP